MLHLLALSLRTHVTHFIRVCCSQDLFLSIFNASPSRLRSNSPPVKEAGKRATQWRLQSISMSTTTSKLREALLIEEHDFRNVLASGETTLPRLPSLPLHAETPLEMCHESSPSPLILVSIRGSQVPRSDAIAEVCDLGMRSILQQ